MLVNRHSDKQRGQKGEDVGLQESDEQFQEADRHRTSKTAYGNSKPENDKRVGRRSDEGDNHGQHEVPGKHVRQETNRQHRVFDDQTDHLNNEQHGFEKQGHRTGQVHLRNQSRPEPDRAMSTHPRANGHGKHAHGQRAGNRQRSGRRSEPGDHAQQIADQDEEEEVPQEGQKTIRILRADRGACNFVADEHQNRLKEVPDPSARGTALAHSPSQGHKNDDHDRRNGQFQDHVLRELEVNSEDFDRGQVGVDSAGQVKPGSVVDVFAYLAEIKHS